MTLPRPPRRHPRRPGVHRALRVAPETAAEVLAAAPDVSRETSLENSDETSPVVFLDDLAEASSLGRYVAGGIAPAQSGDVLDALWDGAGGLVPEEEPPPPLHKSQVARLEAMTAMWVRDVRVGGPQPDDTLLYAAPSSKPPVPPSRSETWTVVDVTPPPVEAGPVTGPPAPATAPVPGLDREPVPARRVSDWVSRHDPRSLEFGVRERLGRPVPLRDVSLFAGPVLDQGTTPPLSPREASACVGMALTAAANVLTIRQHGAIGTGYALHQEEEARGLYELAQDRDHVHGHDYAGTSVLAGLKAGQELGWWDEYLWALRGTRDVAQVLLQLGVAVVIGVPWSSSLENPDADGVIVPGGSDAGGHALAVVGLALSVAGRPGPWFELQQSRGPAEGKGGRVFLHHRHLAQLLAGIGEAGVPLVAGVL